MGSGGEVSRVRAEVGRYVALQNCVADVAYPGGPSVGSGLDEPGGALLAVDLAAVHAVVLWERHRAAIEGGH